MSKWKTAYCFISPLSNLLTVYQTVFGGELRNKEISIKSRHIFLHFVDFNVRTAALLYITFHILLIIGDYFPSRYCTFGIRVIATLEWEFLLYPFHLFLPTKYVCYLTSLMVWVKLLCSSSSSVKAMMGNYWDVPLGRHNNMHFYHICFCFCYYKKIWIADLKKRK